MNIDDVRNQILNDPAFRDEFKNKGAAASDNGVDSAEWLDFENYFAGDQATLDTLRSYGDDWTKNPQGVKAAAIVTGTTGCNTVTNNVSGGDPFFP